MDANRHGTQWTKHGQYNYAIYHKGETMDAQSGCPVATMPTIVFWYPGKPTVQWGYTGILSDSVRTLNEAF